jgi:hypothetical protein
MNDEYDQYQESGNFQQIPSTALFPPSSFKKEDPLSIFAQQITQKESEKEEPK